MAEWSKALVLGTSLFGGAGSNPASVIFGTWPLRFRSLMGVDPTESWVPIPECRQQSKVVVPMGPLYRAGD